MFPFLSMAVRAPLLSPGFRLDFRQVVRTVVEAHDGKSGPDSQLEKYSPQLILSQDLRSIAQAKDTVLSKEGC